MKRILPIIMLTLLLIGMSALAFNVQPVKASGTIYIRADGSIDPPAAPIQRNGNLYTFASNIYDSIVVERGNIIIDGNGYTLQGSGSGDGFYWIGINNVTIRNTNIKGFECGIIFGLSSTNNSVSRNNITGNKNAGIYLGYDSSNNSVSGNNITGNNLYGIVLYSSSNNSVSGNNVKANNYGGIVVFSSSNNTVSQNNTTNPWVGIGLDNSSGNKIHGNIFVSDGFYIEDSYENVVEDNLVNGKPLVYLEEASNLVVEEAGQVILVNCNNITIRNLNLSNSFVGVELWQSNNSTITNNNITGNNWVGVILYSSSGNKFYHNNFNNTDQVFDFGGSVNVWDDGYPSGGNYWSDYTGIDANGDGIGDTPYIIDSKNQDNYPFVNRSGWKNTKLDFVLTPNPAYVSQTVTILGNLTDRLGHPINDTEIDVYVNGKFVGNLSTNSSGWFTKSAKVGSAGTYIVKVSFSGSETYNPSSHTETLIVYPKIDTNVSFTLSPNPSTVGQTITMLGNLTDIHNNPIGNAPLEVYRKKGAGSWQYVGTISTNSSGWFKATGKITSSGTYQVAVLCRGSYKYNQSYHIETLIVNPSLVSEIAPTS